MPFARPTSDTIEKSGVVLLVESIQIQGEPFSCGGFRQIDLLAQSKKLRRISLRVWTMRTLDLGPIRDIQRRGGPSRSRFLKRAAASHHCAIPKPEGWRQSFY
jgi:hypothetical protein